MPYAPKRVCAYGNCREPAVDGSRYCAEHKKLTDRQYNRYTRKEGTGRKYGRSWKKIRASYAREHPLCEKCFEEGKVTMMDEVHHIVPVSKGGTHDRANLMSLCRSCHTKMHREMGDR